MPAVPMAGSVNCLGVLVLSSVSFSDVPVRMPFDLPRCADNGFCELLRSTDAGLCELFRCANRELCELLVW